MDFKNLRRQISDNTEETEIIYLKGNNHEDDNLDEEDEDQFPHFPSLLTLQEKPKTKSIDLFLSSYTGNG